LVVLIEPTWQVRTYFQRNPISIMPSPKTICPTPDAVSKALGSPARLVIVRTLIPDVCRAS
jgi:hypothetical protein